MTSGRKPGDTDNPRKAAAPSNERVEGAAPRASAEDQPRGAADGAKATDGVTNAPVGEETASAAAVDADLDALLEDVKRERDEYLELARRTKADFENYRKRATKDAQAAQVRGKAALASELVPVLDNLERALKAADEDSELARGVALVLTDLEATLKRAGVEAYDPLGERFDPAWHEALSSRPADDEESGVVIETLERGYRLDGQVLRPARVVVSA
jgi:molecular chaperone GrpE